MKSQISTITGVLIIIVVAILLFGGVFAYRYYASQNVKIINPIKARNVNSRTAGWKMYTNTKQSRLERKCLVEKEILLDAGMFCWVDMR